MTNRRELLQLGLAAPLGVSLSAPVGALTANSKAASPPALYKIIHDSRYTDSLKLAHFLRAQLSPDSANAQQGAGVPLQAVDGDVTDLWIRELQPLWSGTGHASAQDPLKHRHALAGTTGADVLFCLEHLAWASGLRVLWREQHSSPTQEPLLSWVIAAPQ